MSEGQRPDYEVFIVMNENNKHRFYQVGAVWRNRESEGYNGQSVYGRIVLLPSREPKPTATQQQPIQPGNKPRYT